MRSDRYTKQKQLAIYYSNEPTLTDQAGARDTDINVIVNMFTVHGQAPGTSREPIYSDLSNLPTDLRGLIELAQSLRYHQGRLPKELQNISAEELINLSPADIAARLTPVETDKPSNKEDKA